MSSVASWFFLPKKLPITLEKMSPPEPPALRVACSAAPVKSSSSSSKGTGPPRGGTVGGAVFVSWGVLLLLFWGDWIRVVGNLRCPLPP